MEFWGVEVKAGQPLKVQPELGKLIHISQAALGEVKDVKGAKYVPLRLKVDSKNFIIGSLSAEDRPQSMFDLVFEKEFELSHDWKNGSIYFMGYIAEDPVSDEEVFSDEFDGESEDEPMEIQENGKIKPNSGDVKAAKNIIAAAKAASKKEELSDSDSDDDDESGSDDDMSSLGGLGEDSDDDSDEDDDEEGSSSDEEELPKKSKKRPAESAEKTPVPAKKAKSATPDKSGNKKGGHVATPFPSKPAGKTPTGSKSKDQPPKSAGPTCKSCSKAFNSDKALESHTKAKHGGK